MCRSSSPELPLRWLRRSVSRLSGGIRCVFGEVVVDVVEGAGVEEGIFLVEVGREVGRYIYIDIYRFVGGSRMAVRDGGGRFPVDRWRKGSALFL